MHLNVKIIEFSAKNEQVEQVEKYMEHFDLS